VLKVEDFHYELPPELIAQHPLAQRDRSRLLVLERQSGRMAHRAFADLPDYLRPGDALVLNDSRVIRARLMGHKLTGGRVEVFLVRRLGYAHWEVLVRPGRRTRPGTEVSFGPRLRARLLQRTDAGGRVAEFSWEGDWDEVLEAVGGVPLPPYVRVPLDDPDRYQTVYARHPGSVAAPTAGLHFTPELLARVADLGVTIARLTLHVGPGTFRPVKADFVEDHTMHAEYYRLDEETATALNRCRAAGGRLVAVGTTVTRTLESLPGPGRELRPGEGWTSLFIYPGHRFRVVDALVTNFHLPRSSLLMLVSAFAGRELVLSAYAEAIARRYRFYSFGDAMLIL
jgi:S-adenosylmethionine:tRNA ribosyltransferase-isomerase